MKIKYTPVDQIEDLLESDSGTGLLIQLGNYHKQLEEAFQKLFELPVKLTEEAMSRYISLGNLEYELRVFLLTSGILPAFQWEDWIEGSEIVKRIRHPRSINRIKALKLLYLIIKLDEKDCGLFERSLKNGKILWLLENVLDIDAAEKQSGKFFDL